MKAQSADKMKAVVTGIVAKVCPGFAWADGEVLVIESWPYQDLHIEVIEDMVSVGFYFRVFGQSYPCPVFSFYASDWTLSGYEDNESEKHEWKHKDLEKGKFNETIYNKILEKSNWFAGEIDSMGYATIGDIKKYHRL